MWLLNQQAFSCGSHASMRKDDLCDLESHLLGSQDGGRRGLLHKMRRHQLAIQGTCLAAQEVHLPSLHANSLLLPLERLEDLLPRQCTQQQSQQVRTIPGTVFSRASTRVHRVTWPQVLHEGGYKGT